MEERPVPERPIAPRPETATLYTDEEAQEILTRAMGLSEQGVSRESLMRMAGELGISPAELARAESSFREGSATSRDHAEFQQEQRQPLQQHLVAFGLVVPFLFLFFGFIAFFVAHDPMVLIPAILTLLGWGLGVAFHIADYLNSRSGYEYDRRFQKWLEKKQRRLARAERKQLKG